MYWERHRQPEIEIGRLTETNEKREKKKESQSKLEKYIYIIQCVGR